jgi:membrane-associated phospholipid phosphatase
MFPEYGFVDTINKFSGINHDSAIAKSFINPFAAIPSMHCAFAVMIGGTGALVCRHWWSRAFWACWPFVILWVVIVTGNHYWIDAVLGWMVAVTAAVVAHRLFARARPEAWAFRSSASREAEA